MRLGPRRLSLLAQGGGAALGFLVLTLIARRLPAAETGTWFLYLAVSSLCEMLRGGLVLTGLVREAAGVEASERAAWHGAAGWLALAITGVLGLLLAGVAVFGQGTTAALAGTLALALIASLPSQLASGTQQAAGRFGRLLVLRVVPGSVLLGLLLLAPAPATAEGVARLELVARLATSALALGWSGLGSLGSSTRAAFARLAGFGRYSLGTLLATHLLRSADPFLLGAFVGPAAVAVYGVPQKLIEAVEVPIRALATAAFPRLAQRGRAGDRAALAAWLRGEVARLTLALLPVLALAAILAEPLTRLLGGPALATPEAVAALRWLCLYAALLPLDRAIGLVLDALGRPQANLAKVTLMATLNGVGDLWVLQHGGGVVGVAMVSVGMTAAGVVSGLLLLGRELPALGLVGAGDAR